MSIITIILIVFGACGIITHGHVFDSLRCKIGAKSKVFYQLVTCMQCTGFWVGCIVALIYGYEFYSFLIGCLCAGTNEILDAVISKLDR